jgi:hypothetical protein
MCLKQMMQGHCTFLQGMPPYAPSLSLNLPNVVAILLHNCSSRFKYQPNLAFMNFFDQSNETLNEPLSNLNVLHSRKSWIMGWTMGLKKACLKVLFFCNKDMKSSFTCGFRYNIGMCCFVIIKVLILFSIDFLTPGLNFPSKVSHSPKEDLDSLSNGFECSHNFL